MNIKFKATKVFNDVWTAVNETFVNAKGKLQRKYRLIEEVGGSRSSKTWSNFQVLFLYAYENRYKNIVVMRDTAVDCRDKVETDWIKWLKDPNLRVKQFEDGEITVEELDEYLSQEDLTKYLIQNKQLHTWTFKQSGSFITFTGTDDEDRSIGKSQNVLWVNEPYKFSEEVFKQLTQRTSDFILVDWNPKQNHFIEKQRLKPDTFTHNSSLLDNPFCPLESRKQILSYQPLQHAKAVKDKLISSEMAMNYDFVKNELGFDKKILKELERCVNNELQGTSSEYHYMVFFLGMKAEKPNRIFKWNKIPRSEFDKLEPKVELYGIDWGKNDPWGIIHAKYYDGALYLRELNYLSENKWRELLAKENPNELARITGFTPDGDKQDTEGLGIVAWMADRLKLDKKLHVICDNNRELKIAMLRRLGYQHAYPASKPKGSILDGITLLQDMAVYYTDDSPNLEYEQENYSWKVDRYGVVLDEPEDADNHCIDPARYTSLHLRRLGFIKQV